MKRRKQKLGSRKRIVKGGKWQVEKCSPVCRILRKVTAIILINSDRIDELNEILWKDMEKYKIKE